MENNPTPLTEFYIHLKYLALCANDHGYDASKSSCCPHCSSYDRIMIETILSPQILHKRLWNALQTVSNGK